jgi:hypothetical protein
MNFASNLNGGNRKKTLLGVVFSSLCGKLCFGYVSGNNPYQNSYNNIEMSD